MSGSNMKKISRSGFLGLGLSAALFSTGACSFGTKTQPGTKARTGAKERTVNFGAATTGKLSNYCRGDGSDETEQIKKCLAENLYVEIDEPPAGVGYGFRAHGGPRGGGLLLRSGHEISGLGADSKLLRVGEWKSNSRCFTNEDWDRGNSSIKLNNIYIEGFRDRPDVPTLDSDADSTGIVITVRDDSKWCNDIHLTGVEVHNWPGVGIRIRNGSNVTYKDVKVENSARGGVVFNTSRHIHLLRTTSANTGDDAITFYVTGSSKKASENQPIYDIIMDSCKSSTREDPEFGAALKFGGAWDATVTNSTFSHARNALVAMATYPGGFHPKNIKVHDCKMLGGMKYSLQIKAIQAEDISIRNNYMYRPARHCVDIISLDDQPHTFDVTVADNTMVDPGSGEYIRVQQILSGVRVSGNREQ